MPSPAFEASGSKMAGDAMHTFHDLISRSAIFINIHQHEVESSLLTLQFVSPVMNAFEFMQLPDADLASPGRA